MQESCLTALLALEIIGITKSGMYAQGWLFLHSKIRRSSNNSRHVWGELQAIEAEYTDALTQRQYIRIPSTEDYFIGGWSKANEIKSWHLYEQFMGLTGSSLIKKLPEMPN